MIPLVQYSDSSESSESDSEDCSNQEVVPTTKVEKESAQSKEETSQSTVKKTAYMIPSFDDIFEKVEKPDYVKRAKCESDDVVRYFSIYDPVKKEPEPEPEKTDESKKDEEKEKVVDIETGLSKEEKAKMEKEAQDRADTDERYRLRKEGQLQRKEKLKRQRLNGQSGIGENFRTWRSETEMVMRQQYQYNVFLIKQFKSLTNQP